MINKNKMTPEEREQLRQLMETPGMEKEWDFFADMSEDVPPPETFMIGRPELPRLWLWFAAVGALIVLKAWLYRRKKKW